jgi:hypothetical protein
MGLTVKVNGSDNGLVHKGSNHMAKCTAPDVCKTPSPGGPVPIPYPVIISKSSDLANGTTTVKADGEMAAIKDCEYSTCNGDEAGTAGGVVSSTNMKEAKFILFSFDVKMDGKNACRLGDKMTMNHQNTVCMAGTFPTNVGANPFLIDCENFRSPPKDDGSPGPKPNGYSACDKKQICKKCEELNNQRQAGQHQRRSPADQDAARAQGDAAASAIRSQQESCAARLGPGWTEIVDQKEMFYDDCALKEWRQGGRDPGMRTPMFDPDHIHEIQIGGNPIDPNNFKWMSSHANRWVGRKMQDYDPAVHTGVQANCC